MYISYSFLHTQMYKYIQHTSIHPYIHISINHTCTYSHISGREGNQCQVWESQTCQRLLRGYCRQEHWSGGRERQGCVGGVEEHDESATCWAPPYLFRLRGVLYACVCYVCHTLSHAQVCAGEGSMGPGVDWCLLFLSLSLVRARALSFFLYLSSLCHLSLYGTHIACVH